MQNKDEKRTIVLYCYSNERALFTLFLLIKTAKVRSRETDFPVG